jgi:MFS family permease
VAAFTRIISPAILSLIFARVLYAINWFNFSSVFYLILVDFKGDISMLGIITAGFLIGIGIFQIPAGILAAKYDPKKLAFSGLMILSVSSLLSGMATDLFQMVILRFIVGAGMAFFFGPSVILISTWLGKGSDGLGIGILNSAHSLGGLVGLFGWILVAQLVGWRISLIISGILGIMSCIFLFYLPRQKGIPSGQENNDNGYGYSWHVFLCNLKNSFSLQNHKEKKMQPVFKIKLSDLRLVLINKSMITIGLSLLGIQIGWNLVSTFIVLYLKNDLHSNPVFAGLIYDRTTKRPHSNKGIILLIICGLIVSFNLAFFSLENIYVIVLSIISIGIFISGGFVVPYSKAREMAAVTLGQRHYETLAVSFINGLSLFGAFWVPFVFSIIVKYFDYSIAWLIGGLITLIFILPALKLIVR